MDKPLDETRYSETLTEDRRVEGIYFRAGSILKYSGTGNGTLVQATITGKIDIQGVSLSAENHPITLEFEKVRDQLHPGLKSATSHGAALTANNIAFKQETPLLFYRTGHIGKGDLLQDVEINDIWFGPRRIPTQPAGTTTETATEKVEPRRPSRIATIISLKLTSKSASPAVELNHDIAFYPDGRVAYGTLSRRQIVNGMLLEAGSLIFFYSNGQLFGGTLAEQTSINGITCSGKIRLRENGSLLSGELVSEQMIDGIKCTGQFKLYDNGKLFGSTLLGKQKLGEFLCEGHFTLYSDGSPNQVYLADNYPERGAPYKAGWLLRLNPNGHSGLSERPPGSWQQESFDLVSPDDSDFNRYYQPLAAACTNQKCECHQYDPVDSYKFNHEIRGYRLKGCAFMNRQLYAEAELVQTKALNAAIKYQHLYGGDHLAELCRDIARRLTEEGRLEDALNMINKADAYWQEFGKQRRDYQVEQCRIAFQKCQIYYQQKDYSILEPLLKTLINNAKTDTNIDRSNWLENNDYSEAEKMLGDCYVEQGNFEKAETHYNKAISINSSDRSSIEVFRSYHGLLLKMNNLERAAEYAAQIKRVEQEPSGWMCGSGYLQEAAWLEWQPTLNLD